MIKDSRIKILFKLSSQAFGKYKLQIGILTFLGFLGGILEGIGINAIIPLFSFVVGDKNKGTDIISRYIEKFFAYINLPFSLKYLLIFISLLFIFKAIVIIISDIVKSKITLDYEEQTRNRLFAKTIRAEWGYLLKQKLGHLENIIMTDVGIGSSLLKQISTMIMILSSLLIYVLVAINISIYVTLITLILGGILFLIFKPLIYKTRKIAQQVTKINKTIAHYVNENILGIKTVKATDVGGKVIGVSRKYFREVKNHKFKIFILKSVTNSVMQPISLVFICIVFAFSYRPPSFIHFFYNPASFNLAALIAVIYLIQKIFQYLQQFQMNLLKINETMPYLQSALNYEAKTEGKEEKGSGSGNFQFNHALEFKNIYFSYTEEKEILVDVNFTINKGEMIGLIGPSGAGKTTVVDLILRLFNPSEGKILLDKKEISEINMSGWRNNIGYVSQDIFLANDTIAHNIKFYDDSISEEEMVKAAKDANIYDFIQSLPNKFETVIGERGVLLSAGQKQRVVIARILARKPELLILDEATSALDNESELKIQKVIENLKGKVTVLVIAHRLSTVENSDRLVVLENGSIIEQGSPEKLLKDKKSYFYKVYNIRK